MIATLLKKSIRLLARGAGRTGSARIVAGRLFIFAGDFHSLSGLQFLLERLLKL
jgi:hypothetical protein